MKTINNVISDATAKIDNAIDEVSAHVQKVLIKAHIPREIAMKYSANFCHGGEWILDDGKDLAQQDIHLMSNEELVKTVKELENID